MTLVIDTDSADIIATLILLKREVEEAYGSSVKMTIADALEAHLLAKEIAEAGVGIIQITSKPFPALWEMRRM